MKAATLFLITIFFAAHSAFSDPRPPLKPNRYIQDDEPVHYQTSAQHLPCDTIVTYTISPEGDTTRTYTVQQYRGSQAVAKSIDDGVYNLILWNMIEAAALTVAFIIFLK